MTKNVSITEFDQKFAEAYSLWLRSTILHVECDHKDVLENLNDQSDFDW